MSQFRWITKALCGSWMPTRNAAMADAVINGQAQMSAARGHKKTLNAYARIEARPARPLADSAIIVGGHP